MVDKDTMVPVPGATPEQEKRIQKIAWEVAVAEGSPVAWNNPLDLNYDFGFLNDGPQNSDGVLKFRCLGDGWLAGYEQVKDLLGLRHSSIYSPDMTILQVGIKYAGVRYGPSWARNVALGLGLKVTDKFSEA